MFYVCYLHCFETVRRAVDSAAVVLVVGVSFCVYIRQSVRASWCVFVKPLFVGVAAWL